MSRIDCSDADVVLMKLTAYQKYYERGVENTLMTNCA